MMFRRCGDKSYVEIGMEGHAQHRSQGTPAFSGNPFFRRPIFLGDGKSKRRRPANSIRSFWPSQSRRSPRSFPNSVADAARALASAEQRLSAAQQIGARARSRSRRRNRWRKRESKSPIFASNCEASRGRAQAPLYGNWTRVADRINPALAEDVALPSTRMPTVTNWWRAKVFRSL